MRKILERIGKVIRHRHARRYQTMQVNLLFLRGRNDFADHIRENATNFALSHITYDDLTISRPVDRLTRSVLKRLASWV